MNRWRRTITQTVLLLCICISLCGCFGFTNSLNDWAHARPTGPYYITPGGTLLVRVQKAKELADANRALDLEVIETGAPAERETEVTFGDGDPQSFIFIKFPFRDGEGALTGVGTIATDITERKNAETARLEIGERLEKVTGNLPGIIFRRVLHSDGTVSYPHFSGQLRPFFVVDGEAAVGDAHDQFSFNDPFHIDFINHFCCAG